MNLPYCTNCRCPFDGKEIPSWKCYQPLISTTESSEDDDTNTFAEASEAFSGRSNELPYQMEDDLCGRFNKDGLICVNPACKQPKKRPFFKQACPKCKLDLPFLERVDPRTITVTGPSGAGKTHYLFALHQWWTDSLCEFDLTVIPAMSEQVEEGFEVMRNTLMEKQEVLEANVAKTMVSFTWQILPSSDHEKNGILVTLPDVAGERLLKAQYLLANRYYHYTAGIIFLVDANRLMSTVNAGEANMPPGQKPKDHFDVANAMVEDMKNRLEPKPGEKFIMPIAVCVNKIDKLIQSDPEWRRISSSFDPFHDQYFDHHTCGERSVAVRQMLLKYQYMALTINLLERHFQHVMFFSIATLGSDRRKEIQLNPVSVEDPFLYLMWHLDFVH